MGSVRLTSSQGASFRWRFMGSPSLLKQLRPLDIRVLAVGVHVDQREARSVILRLDGYNVLILFRADFQFDIAAARSLTGQFMRAVIGPFDVRVQFKMAGVALEHLPVFLQLILVVSDELGRGVLGLILQGDNLQAEAEARNVHVGTLVVAIGIVLLQTGAGINRQPHVRDLGALADVDAANRCVDVDLLVFSVLLLLYVHAAGRQEQSRQGGETESQRADETKPSSAHADILLLTTLRRTFQASAALRNI